MKFLVVGLGSMGKRRIRNLMALGEKEIAGFDIRADRRKEAVEKYGIRVYDGDLHHVIDLDRPDALIISTGPAEHMTVATIACDHQLHCFIEASVTHADRVRQLADRTRGTALVVAPSCTMLYYPGPQIVRRLIQQEAIGQPLTFVYHTGQYLPDWHPWEDIQSYYVSKRDTGGCREIVPFELTWLNAMFGTPAPLTSVVTKLSDIDADIDDVYMFVLQYPRRLLGSVVIEVLSRPKATRELRIVGTRGIIVLSADENVVRYVTIDSEQWTRIPLHEGTKERGYINPEEPYIAEMNDFRTAVRLKDPQQFPNSLLQDYEVLKILETIESLKTPV